MSLEHSKGVGAQNRVEVPPHGLQNRWLSGIGLCLSRDDLGYPGLLGGIDDNRLS